MAHVDDIRYGTHGAKVGLVGDESKDNAQTKPTPDHSFDQNRSIHISLSQKIIKKSEPNALCCAGS
jgi:hypothetical protein